MSVVVTGPEKLPPIEASFTSMLLKRFAATPDKPAYKYPEGDGWKTLTWKDVEDDTTVLAAGLISLGLESEQRVGIAANTSMNWILADISVALAGGAVTTVYASTGAPDVAFILGDSNVQMLFAENQEQLDKVIEQRENLPELHKVILFDGDGDGDFAITLEQLRDLGRAALAADADVVKTRAESVTSDQLATLIYTSGTTGKPKGVELPQSNWGYIGSTLEATDMMTIDDVQYLWLPMAHVFGTVLLVAQVAIGFCTAVDGDVKKVLSNVAVIKPTFMGAVPRIFEKIYASINAMAKAGGEEKAKDFANGVALAEEYKRVEAAGETPSKELSEGFAFVDEVIMKMVRGVLGGNIRFFISGSAPLSKDIAEFFNAAGMPILEGYGLTETSAVAAIVRISDVKFGTVGQPAPGTEIRIADDGEILVRSGAVMRGYRNRPDANEEVFVGDGWFATGDIGEFDEFDRLRITDRKKDLFKTSGGKYVAPSAIESQFKAICGVAGNMVVHANNRKFVSALITLDPDAVAAWATAQGKPTDVASVAKDPAMEATVQAAVDKLNEGLNHWEKIQKFVILDHDFTIDAGELTPSLKVKRKVVEEHNMDLLDSFYA